MKNKGTVYDFKPGMSDNHSLVGYCFFKFYFESLLSWQIINKKTTNANKQQ